MMRGDSTRLKDKSKEGLLNERDGFFVTAAKR
jgi:hypothetical protein